MRQQLTEQEADAIRDKWFRVVNLAGAVSLIAFYLWFRMDRLQEVTTLTEAAAQSLARLAFIIGLLAFATAITSLMYCRIKLYGRAFLLAHSWADYRFKDQRLDMLAIGIIVVIELLLRAKAG